MKRYLTGSDVDDCATETGIDGLVLVNDFITPEEEAALVEYVDTKGTWSDALKRRTQQYGAEYDYKKTTISTNPCPAIPPELDEVIKRLEGEDFLFHSLQKII